MANSLSSKKRARQNVKCRIRNRAGRSAVRTQIRHFTELSRQGKNIEEIEKELRLAQKKIDKLAANGCIHKNTAGRRKASLMRKFDAVKARGAGS